MSEPDGPDATRRTLIRGVVVLGAVGVGAGLSRLGEGTYDLVSPTGAESDIAQQAPAPVETAEPAKTAKPAGSAKTKSTKSEEPAKSKSTKAEEPAKSKSTKAEEPSKSAKSTESAKSATSEEPDKPAKTKPKPKPKPAGKELGPAKQVPVGGGAIYKGDRVVVTQPKAGEYKAFDALCTHANCLVDEVKDSVIHCPCHNARFSAADGSVVKPSIARRPLVPKGKVTEADGKLYLT